MLKSALPFAIEVTVYLLPSLSPDEPLVKIEGSPVTISKGHLAGSFRVKPTGKTMTLQTASIRIYATVTEHSTGDVQTIFGLLTVNQ